MPSPLFGLGFRPRYFGDLVDARPRVDWLELVSENFMAIGGRTRQMLDRLAADYPLALHGVSLSIAGAAPLDEEHLAELRALADAVEPVVVSDHLCWTSWRGHESHDLLPIAYTQAALDHVAARVAHVQARLGRRLVLENASAYVAFAGAEMDEAVFLAELCGRSGCGVLLDVNNLIVNAANLGWDPRRYLDALAPRDVVYFHVAGHSVLPDVRIDTHDAPVPDPVWALYADACARFPGAHTILERDERLPGFDHLVAELDDARQRHKRSRLRVVGGSAQVRGAVASRPRQQVPAEPGAPPAFPTTHWHAQFFDAVVGAAPLDDALLSTATPVAGARGVRVYRDAYVGRLQHGLGENFPALAAVLGKAVFERLIADYVAAHPPRSWRFGTVGAALPAFIETYEFGVGLKVEPTVLADLAALEHAELAVHDAPDDGAPLDYGALGTLSQDAWADLRLRCSPHVRLLRWRFDVLGVVNAAAAGSIPEPPPRSDGALLIGRQAGEIARVRLHTPRDVVAADRLLAGERLVDACGGDVESGALVLFTLIRAGAVRELLAASPPAANRC
jgi:uncharacterized protein (UPF0276 family)